jgi:hypothetical protein
MHEVGMPAHNTPQGFHTTYDRYFRTKQRFELLPIVDNELYSLADVGGSAGILYPNKKNESLPTSVRISCPVPDWTNLEFVQLRPLETQGVGFHPGLQLGNSEGEPLPP